MQSTATSKSIIPKLTKSQLKPKHTSKKIYLTNNTANSNSIKQPTRQARNIQTKTQSKKPKPKTAKQPSAIPKTITEAQTKDQL